MPHDSRNTRYVWGEKRAMKLEPIQKMIAHNSLGMWLQCVEIHHNVLKCHYFFTHFFLHQKRTKLECTNMHWFWVKRRQIKQFCNHIFSFRKYETVVQQTNVNEGKTCKTDRHSQKNIQYAHTHMHTLTFSREITTVPFFSVQSLVLFRHFSKYSVRSHSSANKRKFYRATFFFMRIRLNVKNAIESFQSNTQQRNSETLFIPRKE